MKTIPEAEYLANPQAVFELLKEESVQIIDASGQSKMHISCTKPDPREDWEIELEMLRHYYDDVEILNIAQGIVEFLGKERGETDG